MVCTAFRPVLRKIADIAATPIVNDHLRKHNHAAFSPAALAHVAAQIDALREHAAAEAFAQRPVPSLTRADAGGARSRHLSRQIDPSVREDGTIERGVVLTSDVIIAAMPDTWPGADAEGPISDGTGGHRRRQQPPENSASRLSALEAFAGEQDYASRLRRLRELREDRDEARGRLAQLQQLTQLLQPLEDPGAQVQPNLVGREGEVGKELERMRVLVERVSGKVTHW